MGIPNPYPTHGHPYVGVGSPSGHYYSLRSFVILLTWDNYTFIFTVYVKYTQLYLL